MDRHHLWIQRAGLTINMSLWRNKRTRTCSLNPFHLNMNWKLSHRAPLLCLWYFRKMKVPRRSYLGDAGFSSKPKPRRPLWGPSPGFGVFLVIRLFDLSDAPAWASYTLYTLYIIIMFYAMINLVQIDGLLSGRGVHIVTNMLIFNNYVNTRHFSLWLAQSKQGKLWNVTQIS